MWNARSARWPLGLRWAGRSAFPLGFLIPVFVRRTFDQCRRFESAFSSENAAGKWRRQWHPPGPAQLIALVFFFSLCVHVCECRMGDISYFRVRARMDRIVADPSLVDSQGGRLGKVSRAGSRPRSRRFSLRFTRSRHRRNRGWWGWRKARSSLRRGSSGESDTGPEVPISPRGRGPVFYSDLGKRRLTGSEILI